MIERSGSAGRDRVAALSFFCLIRFTERGRRLLRASHFDNSPGEMRRFYFDVLKTGEAYGIPLLHLSALRERIEAQPIEQTARLSERSAVRSPGELR